MGWSAVTACWWLVALALVWREKSHLGIQNPSTFAKAMADKESSIQNETSPTVTIFKPLPLLTSKIQHPASSPSTSLGTVLSLSKGSIQHPTTPLAQALESFVSQLDQQHDMLIGIEERDKTVWQPIFDEWRGKYPQARFQTVFQPKPTGVPNPKIAWQMQLAPRATGTLWLWSDADIIAPPDFLRAICAELEASGAKALTSPYVIRIVERAEGVLDALFVNIEFYPGVLLLRKRGPVSFAFGAATLFHANEFQRKVDWQKLGSALADDFELGKLLGAVALGRATVETLPDQASWRESLQHYLRWHKTIRWCQPFGYAAQISILPVLGWMIFILANSWNPVGWLGWLFTSQIETLIALLICRLVGCRISPRWLWMIEGWTLLRPMVWLASWLPLPVKWGGDPRKWWKPTRSKQKA